MKYFKLGSKGATSYVDQRNLFAIANNQVVAVDENDFAQSSSSKAALKNGHIAEATEQEFNDYEASKPKPEEAKTIQTVITGGEVKSTSVTAGEGAAGSSTGGADTGAGGKEQVDYEDMTNGEMIDELKESKLPDADKKKLTTFTTEKLIELHKKYVSGQ